MKSFHQFRYWEDIESQVLIGLSNWNEIFLLFLIPIRCDLLSHLTKIYYLIKLWGEDIAAFCCWRQIAVKQKEKQRNNLHHDSIQHGKFIIQHNFHFSPKNSGKAKELLRWKKNGHNGSAKIFSRRQQRSHPNQLMWNLLI